ncbi:MAG: hypothetical protein J3K34DRAFT_457786 [Monoraphidium minutum]|nr:MAG: hypothetical protein J3K34DRAFT_457786 [Monoraphidium minutum]
MPHQIILHVDADAFFCQVELLRDPSLAGRPLAIQQQYDVISVDHDAQRLGVHKHMAPAQARAILEAAGGRLVHVYCEGGNRVSYRPYREASGALMRLMRRFLNAAVVEKASVDEAYVLCTAPAGLPGAPAAGGDGGGGDDESWDLSPGIRLGSAIRDASRSELGLVLSVGVATNKLLAKLASRAAKPDGLLPLESGAAVRRLLQQTPVARLPGVGGMIAEALEKAGIKKASDLARWQPEELAAAAGGGALAGALAARLVGWGRGRDDAAVVDAGPPKSIQARAAVQMTLTTFNLAHHSGPPSAAAAAAAGRPGGGGGGGAGAPLMSGRGDALPRLGAITGTMLDDLLGRVLLDRHSEDRWPRKLGLRIALAPPGAPAPPGGPGFKAASKTCPFPTPGLLLQPDPPPPGGGPDTGGGGSGGGGGAAGGAAAAVRVAGAVSERSWGVPAALRAAVHASALALAQVRAFVTTAGAQPPDRAESPLHCAPPHAPRRGR